MKSISKGKQLFSKKQVIGHRGAAAYAPENTLAAFKKAHALGCRFVEFDVMLSVDGEPFVFHDESLRRTTTGYGEFGLVTADYLRSLDAGQWFSKHFRGEKIPTLHEVLEWLGEADVQANIEIKPYPGFVEQTTIAVLTHINRYWPEGKNLPLVSSFNMDALRLCRDFSPEMPLGLLFKNWQDNWLGLARELSCFSVHLNAGSVTQARVRAIKEAGYGVCVYTVNRKGLAEKFFDWGVDAVFSDYPDVAHASGFSRFIKRRSFLSKIIS